jgi:hypothetical protein
MHGLMREGRRESVLYSTHRCLTPSVSVDPTESALSGLIAGMEEIESGSVNFASGVKAESQNDLIGFPLPAGVSHSPIDRSDVMKGPPHFA